MTARRIYKPEESMIFRISTKMQKKIHFACETSLPVDPNPFADWSTHLFTADRTQYILISNTVSMYSMVMFGRGITTDFQLLDRLTSYMGEFIQDDGNKLIYQRLITPAMGNISFSKALNRSVTGSMDELILQARSRHVNQDISPYDLSFILNEVRLSYLEYKKPRMVFQELSV